MHVVVCGGGVIGASTAYFLASRGIATTVVERTGVASAASGKSGGFLAYDWCDGGPLQALARRSFDLHGELAAKLGGDWAYRRLDTYGGGITARAGRGGALGWVSDRVAINGRLGSPRTTAQVHPGMFTTAMMRAAEARGAMLRIGEVRGLRTDGGRVTGVIVDDGEIGGEIEADAVVIAMGPWSILAAAWLPLPGIFGLKGHSIVFRTGTEIPADALFLEYRDANGATSSPEVFPRTDGTTYVCAISSESPLPVDPADVVPDPGAIPRLEAICREISPALSADRIIARQACFRPVTQDGMPLIGAVSGIAGAYVATGHSVWGILNAPATGEAMAELIADGAATTVDIARFDPSRLAPLDPGAFAVRSRASP